MYLKYFKIIFLLLLSIRSFAQINVGIVTVGDVDESLISFTQEILMSQLNVTSEVIGGFHPSDSLIDRSERARKNGDLIAYRGSAIHRSIVLNYEEDNNTFIIALTDLPITPSYQYDDNDLFLLRGVTAMKDSVALLSSFKVKLDCKKGYDFKLLFGKVITHKFGHLNYLSHCSNSGCVMTSSEKSADYFNSGKNYCENCMSIVHSK